MMMSLKRKKWSEVILRCRIFVSLEWQLPHPIKLIGYGRQGCLLEELICSRNLQSVFSCQMNWQETFLCLLPKVVYMFAGLNTKQILKWYTLKVTNML